MRKLSPKKLLRIESVHDKSLFFKETALNSLLTCCWRSAKCWTKQRNSCCLPHALLHCVAMHMLHVHDTLQLSTNSCWYILPGKAFWSGWLAGLLEAAWCFATYLSGYGIVRDRCYYILNFCVQLRLGVYILCSSCLPLSGWLGQQIAIPVHIYGSLEQIIIVGLSLPHHTMLLLLL